MWTLGLIKLLGQVKQIKIMLLAGGDLMASFGHPGVWTPEDVSRHCSSCECVNSVLIEVFPYSSII